VRAVHHQFVGVVHLDSTVSRDPECPDVGDRERFPGHGLHWIAPDLDHVHGFLRTMIRSRRLKRTALDASGGRV
jgi:hypothetical protein